MRPMPENRLLWHRAPSGARRPRLPCRLQDPTQFSDVSPAARAEAAEILERLIDSDGARTVG